MPVEVDLLDIKLLPVSPMTKVTGPTRLVTRWVTRVKLGMMEEGIIILPASPNDIVIAVAIVSRFILSRHLTTS